MNLLLTVWRVIVLGQDQVLVPDSLAETLWRLEEARRGFRIRTEARIAEALNWVLSRQGLEGAYRGLFAPTEKDLRGVKLLTGETIFSAALRHILGEEALRAMVIWDFTAHSAAKKAEESFLDLFEKAGDPPAKTSGFYCCHKCTIAFLRALVVVRPNGWETALARGIDNIGKKRILDGKWRGFPFYYTLLALSEMDTPLAKAELRYASKKAGGLLNRYAKEDRISRFRKIGLEATMTV